MGKTKEVILEMSNDFSIIAIVFTIILILVFFSAVILYLSFRIRETFRKETNRGAKIALTAFLIGIFFLAGAVLYYSATTLTSPEPTNQPTPTATPTNQPTPTPTNPNSSPSSSPIPTPTNHGNQPTPTPTTTPTLNPNQTATFTAFYLSSTTLDSQITLTFTVINPSDINYKNAVIQTNSLFQSFTVISSTDTINANIIDVGDLPSGTTTVTLQLKAPNHPGTFTDTATLIYQGIQNQITQQITITVRGR
jgi:hypothetical protein